MSLSHLARSIVESPTLRLNEEARLLRERGEPVIHLGIGEPKNKAPISAILASASKLASGDVKYAPTDGLPSLKKAILRYTEDFYDRIVAPENVIVSEGAKQSLFNILFSLCNPQDEVIVLAPYWVSYPEIVKMVQAVPVVVTPEDGSFVPRFEEIERAASSSTKALILNSPNNPSGAVFPEELVAKIVGFCEKKGIWLITDDIYHKLVFDGKVAPPAWRYTEKDVESTKVLVVNGVSKLYGMLPAEVGGEASDRTATDNQTVRNVFVIGPDKKVKLVLVYPMTTGRNFDEVLRVIDSLQLTAKHKVATPAQWQNGQDVIIAGSVSDDEAKKVYPDGWKAPRPYLRIVPQPK